MEADWTFSLAEGDPVIAVPWEGPVNDEASCRFIHLRVAPQRIDEIKEAQAHPPLRSALLRLNGPSSHLWTAKCDAWMTSPEDGDDPFDPYEMDADPGTTAFGAGSYIDLLFRKDALFASFEDQRQWVRAVIDALRVTPAGAARVELVMRPADVDQTAGFGLTCFVEGCGPTADEARRRWAEALGLTLAVLLDTPCASEVENDTIAKRASSSIG